MFRKLSFLLFATALFVNLNAVAASATVLYNDVTSDSYVTGSVFPVYGTTLWPPGPVAAASEFTPTATGNVTDIGVLMDYRGYPGSTNQFAVEVFNSTSNAPSSLLWTSSPTTYTAPSNYTTGTLVDVSVSGLTLTAGQNYFLAVVASDPNSDMDWHQDLNGVTGLSYQLIGGTWSSLSSGNLGAFEVLDNTPTPIPAAAWLLGSGLMGLLGLRKKEKV